MTKDDDARGMLRAIMNQLPDTMEASLVVVDQLAKAKSVLGADQNISVEKLHDLVTTWQALTADCIIMLDNKIERLAGRPGIADDALRSIMTEFRMGG